MKKVSLFNLAAFGFNLLPREGHSVAYDIKNDKAYISFGKTSILNGEVILSKEVLVYDFNLAQNDTQIDGTYYPSSKAWSLLTTLNAPTPRYSHYSFVHGFYLYILGGIGKEVSSNVEIWRFHLVFKIWSNIEPTSTRDIPENLEAGMFTYVQNLSKVFLYGGFYGKEVSRRMYSYDLENNQWKQLRSNYIPLFGATANFHPITQSIYYTGGSRTTELRVQKYHIDSDNWFHVGLPPNSIPNKSLQQKNFQSLSNSRLFSSSFIVGDQIIVVGGVTPGMLQIPEEENQCFSSNIQVFDISCERWSYIPTFNFKGRSGHGIFSRKDKIWIIFGNDGIMRRDMFSLSHKSIISQVPKTSLIERDRCRENNWCQFYQCGDCKSHSYCQMCKSNNSFKNVCKYSGYNDLAAKSTENCKSIIDTCPISIKHLM